jgi:hypothetical protein
MLLKLLTTQNQGGLDRVLLLLPCCCAAAPNGVQVEVIANMCDVLWRSLLGGLQSVLKAAKQEQLVLALLKGYQSYIFSCNTLNKMGARDGFLMDLCKVAGGVDADAQQESVSEGGAPVSGTYPREKGGLGSALRGPTAALLLRFTTTCLPSRCPAWCLASLTLF